MEIHFMAYRQTERVLARKEKTRLLILKAARDAVAEGGFAAVQMSTVAAAAGLATGTLYRYFPSKTDLLTEIFRVVTQWEVDVMGQVAASDGTVRERLQAALEVFSARALQAPRLAYALIFEPVDPAVDAERLVFRRAYAEILGRLVEEGIANREFPKQDTAVVANCIVGALAEALVGPLAPGRSSTPEERQAAIDSIVSFCLNAVSH